MAAVVLCDVQHEAAADSHNCSVLRAETYVQRQRAVEPNDIQAGAGGAFSPNSRAPVANEGA